MKYKGFLLTYESHSLIKGREKIIDELKQMLESFKFQTCILFEALQIAFLIMIHFKVLYI